MRQGFTTGSCAAAASKAACYMLLTGEKIEKVNIITPGGAVFDAKIHDISINSECASCSVIKDGGDDPDVTTGAHIVATVSLCDNDDGAKVFIDGGEGVGRVTLPGLDQEVGMAAINHVPRKMIEEAVLDVLELLDYKHPIKVIISVPEGEEIAKKTFNPRLGIEGGISIIGTSGIVEPMSTKALIDTIKVELNQKKTLGYKYISITPGNYGLEFMKSAYDFDLDKSVKCSNFIGDTLDLIAEAGFEKVLLTGHIGKLIKVSGGMMNTHSKEGDCRMELLSSIAILAGADLETAKSILENVTTEEGIKIIKDAGLLEKSMEIAIERIQMYLEKRAAGRFEIETMMYSNKFGLLAKSGGAEALLEDIKNEGY